MRWLVNKHGDLGLIEPARTGKGERTHYAVVDDHGTLRPVCRRAIKRKIKAPPEVTYAKRAADCSRCANRMRERVQ
jgi:hypothetical protein